MKRKDAIEALAKGPFANAVDLTKNPCITENKDQFGKPVSRAPEARLNDAILSFAHGVSNDFEEVIRALCRDGQEELAGDLTKLRNEWRDASQAAFDSFFNKEGSNG